MERSDQEKVHKWIINGGREGDEIKDEKMPRSMKMIAEAWTKIYLARESIEDLRALYGTVYRWEFQKSSTSQVSFEMVGTCDLVDGVISEGERMKKYKANWEDREKYVLPIPNGYELVLQLKSFMERNKDQREQEEDWVDILAIRRSVWRGGGLGVFAKRRFERGNVVGIYMGTASSACKMVVGKEPITEEAVPATTSINFGDHRAMCLRNLEGQYTIVNADTLERDKPCHHFPRDRLNVPTFSIVALCTNYFVNRQLPSWASIPHLCTDKLRAG